jgi:hypothetical protein
VACRPWHEAGEAITQGRPAWIYACSPILTMVSCALAKASPFFQAVSSAPDVPAFFAVLGSGQPLGEDLGSLS